MVTTLCAVESGCSSNDSSSSRHHRGHFRTPTQSAPPSAAAPPSSSASSSSTPNKKHSIAAKYKISPQEIGKGGLSSVHLGHKIEGASPVAVKMISRRDMPEGTEHALKVEVLLHKQLKHKNIINFIDCWKDRKRYYIVTEFMPQTMMSLVERQDHREGLKENFAVPLLRQVVEGLAYIHSKGIVHRDIKLQNILYDPKTHRVALCDFGFANLRTSATEKFTMWCGTPAYVSPEILNHTPYDLSVDIWALGVVMFITLTGRFPFYSTDSAKLFTCISTGAFSFKPEEEERISPALREIVRLCLKVNPEERITAEDILKEGIFRGEEEEK